MFKHTKIFSSLILFGLLTGCNELDKNKEVQPVESKKITANNNEDVKSKKQDEFDSKAILEMGASRNQNILAIYDIGLNGFKLVISEDKENSKLINKSFISDDGKLLLVDAVSLEEENPVLFSEKIGKTVFNEEINQEAIQNYLKNGFDSSASFKVKKGNGERKLLVMTDPDCPFCKKLESTLESIDNIEITYIYLPITSLHPDAERKSSLLWKAGQTDEEKYAAWQKFQKTGELPSNTNNNVKDYNFEYAFKVQNDLREFATPLMLNLRTGETMVGSLPKDMLEMYLNASKETADKPKHNYKKLYPN